MKRLKLKKGQGGLITDSTYRKYFSGLDIEEGFLLLSSAPAYFVDPRYFSAVKNEIERAGIKPVLYRSLEDIKLELISQGVKTLYIDYDKTTLTEYEEYLSLGVKILDGSLIFKKARAVKDQNELGFIKRACGIAQTAVSETLKILKVGISELEVKNFLVEKMIALGASGESFDTIVAFGANSAVPHHRTGGTMLENNQAVLIDTGAVYKGYCSDITRTVFFGEPNGEFISRYNAVKRVGEIAIEGIKPNAKLSECDNLARKYLGSKNLSEYFAHSLGHGLGLEIHEYPTLSPRAKGEIANGMVFTVEPGVYFDGEYGIRIEDTVYLDGVVSRLMTDDKELKIIK